MWSNQTVFIALCFQIKRRKSEMIMEYAKTDAPMVNPRVSVSLPANDTLKRGVLIYFGSVGGQLIVQV